MFDKHSLKGKNQPSFRPFKTHNAAYESVLADQANAALISVNIYNKAIKQEKAIRSIASSFRFPNMSIIASKDLPLSLRTQLQDVLVDMDKQHHGRRVLNAISYPGYRIASARGWL